jgi:hypothetical protein
LHLIGVYREGAVESIFHLIDVVMYLYLYPSATCVPRDRYTGTDSYVAAFGSVWVNSSPLPTVNIPRYY